MEASGRRHPASLINVWQLEGDSAHCYRNELVTANFPGSPTDVSSVFLNPLKTFPKPPSRDLPRVIECRQNFRVASVSPTKM